MDFSELKTQAFRPKRSVVTAGMPYANGPLHLGHLAGTQIPADIYARWMRMLTDPQRVLFVCGTDDHGSTSELAALQAGVSIHDFIEGIHAKQQKTLERYGISVDVYTGTSRPECFSRHKDIVHDFLRRLAANGMLEKRMSRQWYDPELKRFLQDRFVRGKCPNPKCDNLSAYSDECDRCGATYNPEELLEPKSALSEAVPELRETLHWWLDMWKVAEVMRVWIQGKEKKWRTAVYNEVIQTVLPALRFDNTSEARYKEIKAQLPKHKSKYAAGKKVALTFEDRAALLTGQELLTSEGIKSELIDSWAHRSLTRDVTWGIPLPPEWGPEVEGKSLYVWPDSLIAPIAFTQVALEKQGRDPALFEEFWKDPDARIFQFLGQDNVFFYVLMQAAMWIGTQKDITRQPEKGDWQLNEVFGVYHLMVDGEKMSKSRGNFYTGDQLLDERGYAADQIRYFLALLSLPEKSSNFDFNALNERNRFLAGPMNAAFEKPIAACHSKFEGRVPEGKLMEKVATETAQMLKRYMRSMERAEYATLLYAIENYARLINSMFTQYKPHDDRQPLDVRSDALYSCFFVLKNIMIMLYPFVPHTMEKVRESLQLDPQVFCVDELGCPIPAGHAIGQKQQFFPAVPEEA